MYCTDLVSFTRRGHLHSLSSSPLFDIAFRSLAPEANPLLPAASSREPMRAAKAVFKSHRLSAANSIVRTSARELSLDVVAPTEISLPAQDCKMTSSAFCLKWKSCFLAFVLIWHAGQRIEGHGRTSTRNISLSALIEEAYENRALLRPEKWSELHDNSNRVTKPVQRDNSKQTYSPTTSVSSELQYTRRKLLGVSSTSDGDGKIIFPDTTTLTPRSAPMCYNRTFCENIANYPRDLVNAALARNQSFRFLENIDQMPDVEQRIDVEEEIPLCHYEDKTVYPQSAQNKANEWLFIVNQENMKQGIRVEICTNEGEECAMSDAFPEGYKSSCKQKYIYRTLVAMTASGQILKDQFSFPSSCCCQAKFTGDPHLRIGVGLERDFPHNRTAV